MSALGHISNRYLELKSVVVGIAAANGMQTWIWMTRTAAQTWQTSFILRKSPYLRRESKTSVRSPSRQTGH